MQNYSRETHVITKLHNNPSYFDEAAVKKQTTSVNLDTIRQLEMTVCLEKSHIFIIGWDEDIQ